jgi:heme/copper-type cytochrome/quinol oxidase subunit 2
MMDDEGEIKTFELTGEDFSFRMNGEVAPDIRVNEGDMVRIELTSIDGMHDWVIDEFDAATNQITTGQTTSIEFIADQKGTFEYYCSVGQHRANGMFGTFIVE